MCSSIHCNDQESRCVLGSNYPCQIIFEGDLSDVATCTIPRWAVGGLLDGDVVVRVVIMTVEKMGSSRRFIVLYVLTVLYICEGKISDKRLCGDPSCSGTKSLYYCQDVFCLASCVSFMNCKYLKFICWVLCHLYSILERRIVLQKSCFCKLSVYCDLCRIPMLACDEVWNWS
jgi:hypothetical protein